jgi:glycosyltransferase involved in cell wall biosynthesis
VVKTKAYILPNGVDMMKFRLMPKIEARRLLSWDADLVIILFIGSSLPDNDVYKNQELAEAASAIIKVERDNTVLEKIRDVPHAMMTIYLNAADALIVTSLKEGSPNIVKEAMACNLPVVTVKCGDVSQRLKHVYPSRVVNSYDPRPIASAVMDILKSKSRSNGREELRKQNLDSESVAKSLIKIYNVAVNGN